MKMNFKLGEIKLGDLTINGAEFSVECSVTEMANTYELTKKMIKETPEILSDIAQAVKVMDRLDDEFSKEVSRKAVSPARTPKEGEQWQEYSRYLEREKKLKRREEEEEKLIESLKSFVEENAVG